MAATTFSIRLRRSPTHEDASSAAPARRIRSRTARLLTTVVGRMVRA